MTIDTRLKRTNTREFRGMVFAYLADADSSFEETGMTDTMTNRAKHMWNRFNSEYNYPENQIRIPSLQLRVAEWLSGLALSVDFTYSDIIATAEHWRESTLTDEQAERICEQWFKFLAMSLLQMWKRYDVDITGA